MTSSSSSVSSCWTRRLSIAAPFFLAIVGLFLNNSRLLFSGQRSLEGQQLEDRNSKLFCSKTTVLGENETTHSWRDQVKFLMIGAQKAGSTSIYHYLTQHPRVITNVKKETRCFQQRWNKLDPFCKQWYLVDELERDSNLIAGDFSPGYLPMADEVIPRAKRAFPWAKILVVLRDPIERAFSEHNMNLRNVKLNRTFTDRVLDELEHLRKKQLVPYFRFNATTASMTLDDWLRAEMDMTVFHQFFASHAQRILYRYYLRTIRKTMVSQGMYAMHLHRWMSEFPCDRFLILKSEDLIEGIGEAMKKIHRHVGLEHVPLENEDAKNAHDKLSIMDPKVRLLLERFYQPYNDKLQELLGEEWKQPWEVPTSSAVAVES